MGGGRAGPAAGGRRRGVQRPADAGAPRSRAARGDATGAKEPACPSGGGRPGSATMTTSGARKEATPRKVRSELHRVVAADGVELALTRFSAGTGESVPVV